MHLSRYEEDTLSINLSKFSKIVRHYVFFFFFGIMRSEPNCAILHPYIIPEALPYACFDTKEHESPYGSFHSSILNTRRLIHLGRTAARAFVRRVWRLLSPFSKHCAYGGNLVFKLVHLPRCLPTQPLTAKRTSKICPKHFRMIFELSASKRWPFNHQQINVCVFFCSTTFKHSYFGDCY